MKRVIITKPGGHEALQFFEGPDPLPGPGEVRVSVRAMGVNYADVIVRMGYYEAARKDMYPMTPGFEFSGVVDALGKGVTKFKKGDRVFGFTRFGAYTTSLAVSQRQVFPCPKGWDFPECAAFPGVYLTAYRGLHAVAKVSPGEHILVHSAAGGVGTALLQLAHVAGCRTVAVVGAPHKTKVCRALGAWQVIDRSSQDIWKLSEKFLPSGYDVIFDPNGVSTPRQGFEHLDHGGRLVVYGFAEIMPRGGQRPNLWSIINYFRVPRFSPLKMTTTNRSVMGFNVVFLFHKLDFAEKAMQDMLGWIAQGKIKKVPLTTFPFERVVDAHAAIESGKTVGKLVLLVDQKKEKQYER